MSIFRDFFVKEKPVFTGITRGLGGFGFGASGGGAAASEATGGTINNAGGYKYHIFFDSGELTGANAIAPGQIDVLAIAGGGQGGSYYGGGGGAGGLIIWTGAPLTGVTDLTITIGAGGPDPGPSPVAKKGNPGGDTTITGWGPSYPAALTAKGGGGGGTGDADAGGSGGGRGSVPAGPAAGGAATQPSQNPQYTPHPGFNQYGFPGGSYPPSSTGYKPGGGGGAGVAGGNGAQTAGGGGGGNGQQIPQFPGGGLPALAPLVPRMGPNGLWYAGGGAAGQYSDQSPGAAGYGGGGRGFDPQPNAITQGVDGLGGGGGGRHPGTDPYANAGGKGIVMIRYAT